MAVKFRVKIRPCTGYERLIIVLLLVIMIALAITSCGCTEAKGHLVTEQYTVQSGDTLWSISEQFIQKNTHGPRDIREFYHGIIELNYDGVFAGRQPGEIYQGDRLQINYWVAGEE